MSFDGRMVLITGASRGIGAATARLLAERGADLVLVARGEAPLRQLAAEIAEQTGRTPQVVAGDIGERATQDAVVAQVRAGGRLDVLVNNAGGAMFAPSTTFLEESDELWDEGVRVNILAPARLSRALHPLLAESGRGSIVNVVSTAAYVPKSGRSAYGTTKAAMWALTRYLAADLAPRIRVNAVCPGTVSEDGNPKNAEWESMRLRTPMARFGLSREVAEAIAFVASDAASYTTGQVLFVDGGRVNAPLG